MSDALKSFLVPAVLAVSIAAQAGADEGYQVDNIYFGPQPSAFTEEARQNAEPMTQEDIREFGVRDIGLTSGSDKVTVTLKNKVLQFSTFPLKVSADVDVGIDGITSVTTPDQTLVVLGDDTDRALSGGSILVYPEIGNSLSGPIEPIVYPLDTTPFSQTMLTDDGHVYAVNPTWFSVIQFDVQGLVDFMTTDSQENWRTNDVFLQCGPASKVSVFNHEDKSYYVTSVTGRKLIEYGLVQFNLQKLSQSDCFSAESSSRSKSLSSKDVSRQTLLHSVVKSPFEGYDNNPILKRLLTFDPDTAMVSMFPIREYRGRVAILRSERVDFDMKGVFQVGDVPQNRFALMATSNDATVIYVSFVGSNVVHRLREYDGGLEYVGRTEFDKPVKLINVSPDGRLAGIVTGDARREIHEELILIKNPREISGSGPLKRERFSVLNMQRMLVEQGYQISTDGIYGRQTQQAVDAFLTNGPNVQGILQGNAPSATRSITLAPASGVTEEAVVVPADNMAPAINNNLRGLFPLQDVLQNR